MAINIDEMYRFVQFVANKEQSGFIKPSEFNLSADRAQMQFFMERYNNPAEYQHGRPVPRVAYQQTQKVSDDLRMFIKKVTIPVDSKGIALYPNDYLHFSSASHTFMKNVLEVGDKFNEHCDKNAPMDNTNTDPRSYIKSFRPVDDSEIVNLLDSVIAAPSNNYPIISFFDNGFQVYPPQIQNIDVTYLRRPSKPNWDYTTPNNRPVYSQGTSVDFEWPEQVFNEIAVRILSFVGINLREADLTQYSEGKRQTGI